MARIIALDNARQQPLEKNELHHLPCRVELDGPAPVSQYFVQRAGAAGAAAASFRGRQLVGRETAVPENYTGVVVESSDTDGRWVATRSFGGFTVWGHDAARQPSDDPLSRLDELLEFTALIHSSESL